MTKEFQVLLDYQPKDVRSRMPRTLTVHGDLHSLLSRALPDWCDPNGVLNLRKLADHLEMTRQGVHKWMWPHLEHRIPAKQVARIVDLSHEQTKGGEGFKPAERVDFLDYMF